MIISKQYYSTALKYYIKSVLNLCIRCYRARKSAEIAEAERKALEVQLNKRLCQVLERRYFDFSSKLSLHIALLEETLATLENTLSEDILNEEFVKELLKMIVDSFGDILKL